MAPTMDNSGSLRWLMRAISIDYIICNTNRNNTICTAVKGAHTCGHQCLKVVPLLGLDSCRQSLEGTARLQKLASVTVNMAFNREE